MVSSLRVTVIGGVVTAAAVLAVPTSHGHRGHRGDHSGNGLASLDHIVLFMQENRAFDHYFGTMAGVRGFGDPNAVIASDTNKTSFYSPVDSNVKPPPPPGVDYLLPWYFNHQGGNANDKYQCAVSGSNGWTANHDAWDGGNNNKWASKDTPYSLGYYRREDTPFHWTLAEGWTVADAYHESAITYTIPNRISWVAGTIGIEQAKQGLGGPAIDNWVSPGCEKASDGSPMSCYPYKWKTLGEYLEEVGISWQVYQDTDNFDDNPFAWFESFQKAPENSTLAQKGVSFVGLNKFYEDARAGTLPAVSIIIGPTQLSEHTPYGPLDGAWLQQQIVEAVTQAKAYDKTALMISYDETGGWADHVLAPLPPQDVEDEWITDPYDKNRGKQPVGPGFRVPFYVISPYTRNGGVFSEVAAHESQILFLEKWAAAKGKPFTLKDIGPWRRQHLSDLTRMFDFSNKDMSIPSYDPVRPATTDSTTGTYNGAATCVAKYGGGQPDIPYDQSDADAWELEKGYKSVRGNPNIGHYYVLACNDQALTYDLNAGGARLSAAANDFSNPSQSFIFHAVDDTPNNTRFRLQPNGSPSGTLIDGSGKTTVDHNAAAIFTITDLGDGDGHKVVCSKGGSNAPCDFSDAIANVRLFSVTY